MGKSTTCRHCKEPLGEEAPVSGKYHRECFNELYEQQREKDRKQEATLIEQAEKQQYWARFDAKVRLKRAEHMRASRALAKQYESVEDRWVKLLKGRVFEDATALPKERLLLAKPAF